MEFISNFCPDCQRKRRVILDKPSMQEKDNAMIVYYYVILCNELRDIQKYRDIFENLKYDLRGNDLLLHPEFFLTNDELRTIRENAIENSIIIRKKLKRKDIERKDNQRSNLYRDDYKTYQENLRRQQQEYREYQERLKHEKESDNNFLRQRAEQREIEKRENERVRQEILRRRQEEMDEIRPKKPKFEFRRSR